MEFDVEMLWTEFVAGPWWVD